MKIRVLTLILLGATSACELADEGTNEDLDEEACAAFQSGQIMSIPASGTASPAAPAVSRDERFNIDVDGTGYVTYASTGEDAIIFLDTDVPISVQSTTDMMSLVLSSNTVTPACVDVNGRHEVTLANDTYLIELSPGAQATIGMVIKSPELI